jgi:hypothetical protein
VTVNEGDDVVTGINVEVVWIPAEVFAVGSAVVVSVGIGIELVLLRVKNGMADLVCCGIGIELVLLRVKNGIDELVVSETGLVVESINVVGNVAAVSVEMRGTVDVVDAVESRESVEPDAVSTVEGSGPFPATCPAGLPVAVELLYEVEPPPIVGGTCFAVEAVLELDVVGLVKLFVVVVRGASGDVVVTLGFVSSGTGIIEIGSGVSLTRLGFSQQR